MLKKLNKRFLIALLFIDVVLLAILISLYKIIWIFSDLEFDLPKKDINPPPKDGSPGIILSAALLNYWKSEKCLLHFTLWESKCKMSWYC